MKIIARTTSSRWCQLQYKTHSFAHKTPISKLGQYNNPNTPLDAHLQSLFPLTRLSHLLPLITVHASSSTNNPSATTVLAAADTLSLPNNIPLYPIAIKGLYLMYFCACLVERTWRFALPLVLAFVDGGYHAIAVLGFVSPLACSLLGPAVGRILDRMYRPYGLSITVTLQGIAILASGLVVLAAANNPALTFSQGPLFIALMILSMIERLTAISSELAIERDWVTQLSGKDNSGALAMSNAILRRSDLTCELIGSLAFGWLYSTAGVSIAVSSAVLLSVVFLPIQLYCIYKIAKLAPDAVIHGREDLSPTASQRLSLRKPLTKKQPQQRDTLGRGDVPTGAMENLDFSSSAQKQEFIAIRIRRQIIFALDGWKTYFRQPILLSSLTFVLLFFNVALSPGGLITAFLTAKGMDGTSMALFRGGCATMGFVGTWVGRRLIQQYGLVQAGQRSLAIQMTFLGIATLVYIACLAGPLVTSSPGGGIALPLIAFSVAVVTSRVGMWSFDMVNAQLFQQTVPQREVASASTAEMALCSFSELLMLGLAAYVITPASYNALIYMSFGAVVSGNVLFSYWAHRLQRKTESDDEIEVNGATGPVARAA